MWCVPGAFDDQALDPAGNSGLDPIDLFDGAVLIVQPLHDQHRRRDRRQAVLDAPGPEVVGRPDVVPAPERRDRIVVVEEHSPRHVTALEGLSRGRHAGDRLRLDEHVRSDAHESGDGVTGTGVEQCDRRAVAVPHQHRSLDTECHEELRQHDVGLVVHVVDGAGHHRRRTPAMTVTAVHHDGRVARSIRDLVGHAPPQLDRTESLVQEDQRRPTVVARRHIHLEPTAGGLDVRPLPHGRMFARPVEGRFIAAYGGAVSANRRDFTRAVYTLDAVVQRVPPGTWTRQSPCEAWTAGEVLGHVVWGLRNTTALASGGDTPPQQSEAEIVASDPVGTWNAARDGVLDALDRPGVVQRVVEGPFGSMSIDDFMGFYPSDLLAHTWDIARTAGADAHLPPDLCERFADTLAAMGDVLRRPGSMADAVAVPADADAATRFIAQTGRTP